MKLLGISGSLRAGSINTAALRAAAELAPEGADLTIATLHDIPLYDGDLEASEGVPAAVTALAEAIRASDAVVFSTPEYNSGIPGVLKNALDWLSRIGENPPLKGKPVSMISATAGRGGGGRAQYALRLSLVWSEARVLSKPECLIGPRLRRVQGWRTGG